jgi:release factor glutamine methyltransferase
MKNQELNWLLKEKYHGVTTPEFEADCARLTAGEPLAYLIGSIPFLDCTIYLDSHPLIPRPETEFWVEQAIAAVRQYSNLTSSVFASRSEAIQGMRSDSGLPRQSLSLPPRNDEVRVLDLCAGSGAIGVAVAKAIPEAHLTFSEIDPPHLPTIEKNITQNLSVNRKVSPDRVTVVVGDLFDNVDGVFDFILTNPPYIDKGSHTVDANVEAHEPHLALFGGVAGMEIIKRIIREAKGHLTPTGQLWIEHEPFQTPTITTLATEHGFTISTQPDQYGTLRYSILSPVVAE